MSKANHLRLLGSGETDYKYEDPSADMLETFEYEGSGQIVGFKTDEFTSLCPKTGQPDFANIDIVYAPDKLGVESKSLKLYLFAYRNHGSFHEDCVNKIAGDIYETAKPFYLRVIGDFTRRGGVSIKPISEIYRSDITHARLARIGAQVLMYDRYDFKR